MNTAPDSTINAGARTGMGFHPDVLAKESKL